MTTPIAVYDLAIVGQGAAAHAAALYAARYQMKSVLFGASFGGETATGGLIENYPGYTDIDGFDLMMKLREQVEKYEVPSIAENVTQITRQADCFELTTDRGDTHTAASVILAVGRERRKLGLAHEEEWMGKGVSFCSTCDAPLHRGNVVAVVGGGDAAVKGAVLLSKYAEKVYIIYRQDRFTRPDLVNLRQMEERTNIETVLSASVVELRGDDGLSSIALDRAVNGSNEIAVHGLFIEIGADPRINLARQLGLDLNELDEIKIDKGGQTSAEGVFAAGDVTDGAGNLKQTITAASQGALAASAAYEYVSANGNKCQVHAMGYSLV